MADTVMETRLARRLKIGGEEFEVVWSGAEERQGICDSLSGYVGGSQLDRSTLLELGERHGLSAIVTNFAE